MLIFGIVLLLVSGGMVLGGLFFLMRKKKFLKTSVVVPGVVTHVEVRRSHSLDKHGFRQNWYHPTVRFQTKSGETVERTLTGSKYNNNQVGSNVQVNYDEQNPERITLGNPKSFTIYIPNLIPMFVGGIFGVVGLGLFIGGIASGSGFGDFHETDGSPSKRPGYSRPGYNDRRRRKY
jgi:hypothetical protein